MNKKFFHVCDLLGLDRKHKERVNVDEAALSRDGRAYLPITDRIVLFIPFS
jgi:hypothetical protein